MKYYLLVLAVLLGSGCALLEPFQEEASDKAAIAVNKYCEQTDENFRADFRAAVNAKTQHSIAITCN